MGRHHTELSANVILITGSDEIIGQFIQVIDRRYAGTEQDEQGEGYVFDWDMLLGFTTNLINAQLSDFMQSSKIVELCDKFCSTLPEQPVTHRFEVEQKDGITVQEKIIRFFERKMSRQEAEQAYDNAETAGKLHGVEAFDAHIEKICEQFELDSNELAMEITKQLGNNN